MNHPMTTVGRDIFRAIHEGKWLYIEYRNKSNEVTRYWFDIESIDIDRRMLLGTGLHLKKYSLAHSMKISVPNIQSTQIVDGTYLPANQELLEDIRLNPAKYEFLFHSASNLKELIEFYMEQEGIDKKDYPVGTVHAFQGDEKDEILFSLALTGGTRPKTYDWVRNNKELINVATSRARDKLILNDYFQSM